MYPILLSFGGINIYSVSVAIVLSWVVFSFLFWRALRAQGIDEDRIFDLTFYATIIALFAARVGFIAGHWETFAGKSVLLMLALWIAPGLSWTAGLIGALATVVFLSRQHKVRLGLVLDALPGALVLPMIIGKLGSLLDGSEVGKITKLVWGVHMVGHPGLVHPVQVYEMVFLLVLWIIFLWVTKRAIKQKWAYGLLGVWFFFWYSAGEFVLEFFKDTRVYWGSISANQWMLIGLFAESVGVLYVRGGGREIIRPLFRTIHKGFIGIKERIYAKLSRRHVDRDTKTS